MSNPLRALFAGIGSLLDLGGRSTRRRMKALSTARHPFDDCCKHGARFLDECPDCPDGCPVIKAGDPDA